MDNTYQKIFITALINNFKLCFCFLYCLKTGEFSEASRQLINLPNAHYVIEKIISVKEGTDCRLGIAGIAVVLCYYFILVTTSFLRTCNTAVFSGALVSLPLVQIFLI